MASIANDPGGKRRVLFIGPNKKRKTLYLGKVSKRDAETVRLRVEKLLAAKLIGSPIDAETAGWLADLEPTLADKLAHVGLIAPRSDSGCLTLGKFLEEYIGRRTDVKPATLINWGHTQRTLLAYFGEAQALKSITAGDARDWQRWLQTGDARESAHAGRGEDEGLAPNTVRKRISNAKQFFEDAVSRDLLTKNPFAGLKGSVGANHERDFFVTRAMAAKVLEACPDAQWRLLFALSRYAGLRCPSEHLALRWIDIDWERSRMLVRSTKTEHHEGKGHRIIPIFPEIRPYLDAVWDEPTEDREFVITRYRQANANLRTQLERIIERAGLVPWPKLFQNLRASRATELANEYPEHVAAAWVGHSTIVAKKHYWQVTDDHYEKAVNHSSTAQNPAQHPLGGDCTELESSERAKKKALENPGLTADCSSMQLSTMGDTGLEPVTPTMSR